MRYRCLPLILALAASGARAGSMAEPPPAAAAEAPGGTAWLGLFLEDVADGGAQVVAVFRGGPAANAGIREGDLLVSVNGRPITDRTSVRRVVSSLEPGATIVLEVLRDGKPETHKLVALPGILPAPGVGVADTAASVSGAGWDDTSGGEAMGAGMTITAIPSELRRLLGAPDDTGVLVSRVDPGGPASSSGILVGDVIVAVSGRRVRAPADLEGTIFRGIRGPVPIALVRGGQTRKAVLSLARPSAEGSVRDAEVRRIEDEISRLEERLRELRRELERLRDRP